MAQQNTTSSQRSTLTRQSHHFKSNLIPAEHNVSEGERIISAVLGAGLGVYGLGNLDEDGWPAGLTSLAAGGGLLWRALSGHCAVYGALGVNTARNGAGLDSHQGVHVERAITIQKPVAEIFSFWRKLENLPKIMRHLKSVRSTDGKNSHWVAEAPFGQTVEWDAEIINEEKNQLIAWQSVKGSQVSTAGSVRFRSLPDHGTEVRVNLKYDPPGGKLGVGIAKLMGADAASEIKDDLRRFKSILETGEVPTTEGQTSGRRIMEKK